jgi:hypothetical protein
MGTDGTENQVDATLNPETTETPKTVTITKEEHEKAVREARTAALADVGRLRKESENAVKAAQAAQLRIDKLLKEQEAAELEAASGNPEQLSAVQERQKRRRAESELESAKQQLDSANEKIKQIETEKSQTVLEQLVTKLAAKYNVSADRLSKLAKHTDGSQEEIEDLAKELPKIQTPQPLKTDSNLGNGGASDVLTNEQIEKMSAEEYARHPSVKKRYK